MTQLPVALQLYSVRDDCARDLPGVLKSVAAMGYDGVEFAGYYGHDAAQLKQMLDDLGLKVAGAHVGLDTLLGDQLEESITFHQTLGNEFLIVPGLAEQHRNSTDAWKKTADTMNGIAATLKPLGLHTGYHNHAIEFKPFTEGGELPWDTFFGSTSPDVVMQFDTGNALHGGSDALPFLVRYPHRALTVHLKEYAKDNPNALLGEGDVPFPAIFQACETIGDTRWYIIEQETYPLPPLECAEKCLRNLQKMRAQS
jgi:sugar phosphate isomerase/epimerase